MKGQGTMARKHPNEDQRGNSERQSAGLKGKWGQAHGAGSGRSADWGYCDGATLARLVSTVAGQGAAILLGYSADGGAYKVMVLDGPDKFTEWIPCTTDVTEAISILEESLR